MPRPKGSKNVAKGKRPHDDDDFDENPTERKSSRRSASTPSTAESPKKAAKSSPKKQSNDSKELLEDYFEDEMEGIQQFLNETSEKSPNHQGNVIDDEFEPAAENIPSNDVATTNVSKPTPTKSTVVKKDKLPSPTPPPPAVVKMFPQLVVSDKATDGRCGRCDGCSRSACRECSACKRQEFGDCIDLYCTNQKSGLSERAAIRELYLKTLKKQTEESNKQVEVEEDDESSEEEEPESEEESEEVVQIKVDEMMSMVTKDKATKATKEPKTSTTKSSPVAVDQFSKKAQPNFNVVYGGSSKAAKLRRCGECEGCTRDDCGSCQACADKPRFGGKGTKKKACTERYCRLKAGKVV